MKLLKTYHIRNCFQLLLTAGFVLHSFSGKAQEAPPVPISIYVNAADGLVFGAFYQSGVSGTVTVSPDGSRSVTGGVGEVNLGFPFSPAIFQITANPGTILSILSDPDVVLTGSTGGTMTLHLGNTYPVLPFITTVAPPGVTQVKIGGTLTVGSTLANPPGTYNGTFSVTFIQE